MDSLEQQKRKMIANHLLARDIRDSRVLKAMETVPREKFVSLQQKNSAYDDRPLPIGGGQTISQPYIVALMTQLLKLKGDEKVLEIGTGSGYQTALLAQLANQVYSVEAIEKFYLGTKKLLKNYNNVFLSQGNGYYGWPEHSPYDRIIVTAAPPEIPPPLLEQLAPGGIMVIPVGPSPFSQTLYRLTKDNKEIKKEAITSVAFVPLKKDI